MKPWMLYIPLITGLWLVFGALILTVEKGSGWKGKLFFKVIPILLGLASLMVGAKLLGWI